MNCDGCHAKRCYKHILSTYSIHSSTALIMNIVNRSGGTWHAFHQAFKDTFAKDYTQLKVAVKYGMAYPLDHRIAYYATEFAVAAPVNKAVRPGFYDTVVLGRKEVGSRFSGDLRHINIQAQQRGVTSQRKGADSPPTTTSVLRAPGIPNAEASSSRPRPITRRMASQDLGPSTSRKRSPSPQETEPVPQKRPRFTSNTGTRTKTRGTAKGKSSRMVVQKKGAEKGKGRAKTTGDLRGSNRIISPEESTSVSPLRINSQPGLTRWRRTPTNHHPQRTPDRDVISLSQGRHLWPAHRGKRTGHRQR